MPCNTCNRGLTTISTIPVTLIECDYTKETIIDWKDKLICVRDTNNLSKIGITNSQLNSFLGLVLSGLSFEYNICYFKNEFDNIKTYIDKISQLTQC